VLSSRQSAGSRRAGGFTLVELIAVITIIGIILVFILTAAMGTIRSAEEKATQTLIAKLENGINDRLDALLQSRPDPNGIHQAIAHAYGNGGTVPASGAIPAAFSDRDYVLAMVDYLKRELPDVFFVQPIGGSVNYPLNFAANPLLYLGNGNDFDYVLPLGNGGVSPNNGPGLGIYGASYTAAAGLYKNISAGGITYLATGYDGVDNNFNGLIDEIHEGIPNSADQTTFMTALQAAHQHKAARAEVLYAILVEGIGPFGSVFSRDEFTDKEVMDTDGDGMPEFVDAWGQPLQFYRWPFLYHSDTQRGQKYQTGTFLHPYENMIEEREQNPLDPNQQLMAPAWWAASNNDPVGLGFVNPPFPTGFTAGGGNTSAGVTAFQFFFHSLHEPMTANVFGGFWDRGANAAPGPYAQRRAYYSKPLIVSWGPDKLPGIFGFYPELNESLPTTNVASQLILNENPAPQFDPADPARFTSNSQADALSSQIQVQGTDDISNQTLQAGGGGGSAP
jgi:prepilin-type N-terminal cleavage/methylation domain-containing protein